MRRFHVHVAVDDLAANIRSYSTVFGLRPAVDKSDYAKSMPDDPRVNFAMAPAAKSIAIQPAQSGACCS